MLVGLIGWARSGKDTVGQILVEQHGFQRDYFAKGVYEAAEALDPIIEYDYLDRSLVRLSDVIGRDGWEKAKEKPEVRRTLQRIGTEVGREVVGPDVWIDALWNRLPKTSLGLYEVGNWAITDVRFFNEANWIKEHRRGSLIRIWREGVEPANDHVSENELNDYPATTVLRNDGTLEDLADRVSQTLARILKV